MEIFTQQTVQQLQQEKDKPVISELETLLIRSMDNTIDDFIDVDFSSLATVNHKELRQIMSERWPKAIYSLKNKYEAGCNQLIILNSKRVRKQLKPYLNADNVAYVETDNAIKKILLKEYLVSKNFKVSENKSNANIVLKID